MTFVSQLNLEPSATFAVSNKAMAKMARGERVYNLSVGEPVLLPHPAIVAAAKEALQAGRTLYPPVAGISELRRAAAKWLNEQYATEYASNNVLVTCGGKFAVYALLQMYLRPQAEVLIIAPYWVSYPSLVSLFGGISVIVQTSEAGGWKITAAELEHKISPRTRFLILNNAANPTGAVYERAEIRSLLEVARNHDLLVISDEVYNGLVYDDKLFVSAGSFSEFRDRVVVVQSCSKHFAMTGWRVGFAIGPEAIIRVLTDLQSQSTTGTSTISQWAAVGALEQAAEVNGYVKKAMQARRDILLGELTNSFGISMSVPSALYAFVSMNAFGAAGSDSVAWCKRLIDEAGIAIVPGAAFGVEGYVRLSFGGSEQGISEGLQALKQWLAA